MALATLLHRLRPISPDQHRAQRQYRAEVQELVARVQGIVQRWLSLREAETDNGQLANAAAVNRWELLRLASSVEGLEPPRSVSGLHRNIHTAIVGCARACQLLASGYRGHKSEAVCDGQALLVETTVDLSGLVDQLETRL